MRERLETALRSAAMFRITPARAGKTLTGVADPTGRWDHPRSCGKDLVRIDWNLIDSRITPARAGKALTSVHILLENRDHPRSCGKDCIFIDPQMLFMGSPPLVRERLYIAWSYAFYPGITPARAGKTTG